MSHALFRIIIIFCSASIFLAGCKKEQKPSPPPPVVEVMEVIQKNVPIRHEWVGTTDGMVNATIRAQVTGYLIRQNYKEGDLVNKGQVLFEIDPRPFQAALDQTTGDLARQEAQYENARANLARVRPLADQNALSKKDLDDSVGAEQSALAAVTAARAAVEKARLDLGFTKITSLIDGMAGLAKAQVGDLIGPAQAGELTTVSTINPIKVYYTINEQAYIDFMKQFSSEAAFQEHARKLELELVLADGSLYPYKGTIYAFDREVNIRTGTLRVAGLFPNPANLLRPGQFVSVRVLLGTKKGALLVPQRAVTELQGSYQVAVLGADNRIDIRTVKTGDTVGPLWIIDEGLKPGERIVVEGIQKVKQGIAVTAKPFVSGVPPDKETSPAHRPPAAGQ
ncbi:MAG TPA: efflux RND transporter periplasmic adaptor subunit [Dissulfurispiraceae bacterium]|nr:efflux RND transporter periplasmic adaptor subunit [Dissulfurispiraceae bacterium]